MKNGGEGVKDKSGKTVLNREKSRLKSIVIVRKFHFTTVKCLFTNGNNHLLPKKQEAMRWYTTNNVGQSDKQCQSARQAMSDRNTSMAREPRKCCSWAVQVFLSNRASVVREPYKHGRTHRFHSPQAGYGENKPPKVSLSTHFLRSFVKY